MIDITQDIQPLTTFRNNSVKMMKQLKKTGRPIVLTVNGKPEAAVLSAPALQRLLDIAALADEREGVRQGDADVAAGRSRPASEVFAEMRTRHADGEHSRQV
jgi:prevent-host-death family protein